MSTQVGTLQRSRFAHLIWPAIAVALVVAVSIAVVATTVSRDGARETLGGAGRETTAGVVANDTPSEMSDALGGTAITEVPRAAGGHGRVTPRVGPESVDATTPSELGGEGTAARLHPLP
jgi:hypothetical protein